MPRFVGSLLATSLPSPSALPPDALNALHAAPSAHIEALSPSQRLARLVRELSCQWIAHELSTDYFPDRYSRTTLTQPQLEDRVIHLYALVLEMLAAAESAHEGLHDLFVIKHALIRAMPLLHLLEDKDAHKRTEEFNALVWEVHSVLVSYEPPHQIKSAESPTALVLWGEAHLKIARSYLVPLGPNDPSRTLYFDALSSAERKFTLCLKLVRQVRMTLPREKRVEMESWAHQAHCGIGYIYLLRARASRDESAKRSFLVKAEQVLNQAAATKHQNATYNLACVYALLGDSDKCGAWLEYAIEDGTLPPKSFVETDGDFAAFRNESWFKSLIKNGKRKPENSEAAIDRSVLIRANEYDEDEKRRLAEKTRTDREEKERACVQREVIEIKDEGVLRYTDDEALNAAISFDEDLNRLQASLMREGFSMHTAMGMVLEVGKTKMQTLEEDRTVKENRERLAERLIKVGLKDKRSIPGDGNCQFASVSDQLFNDIEKADWVRAQAVDWLRKNRDFTLPNGAVLWNFAYDQSWDEFCNELSRRGIWGNHLTLVAMAEYFGVNIRVISSVKGDNFVTEVTPSQLKSPRTLLLSHYAEYHYGSLCSA